MTNFIVEPAAKTYKKGKKGAQPIAKKKQLSTILPTRLTSEQAKLLKKVAEDMGISVGVMVRTALKYWLESNHKLMEVMTDENKNQLKLFDK